VRPVGYDDGVLLQDHGIECLGDEEAGLRHLEGDGTGPGHPLTFLPSSSQHRRLRMTLAAAAVLWSASGCATSEPTATADFCIPFEAAWQTYVEQRAPQDVAVDPAPPEAASADGATTPPPGAGGHGRAEALQAREDLREAWSGLLESESAPSAGVAESVRTLDRNLLTAWSGGGDGLRGRVAARRSFENGLGAVATACARGGATVQLETEGVPLAPDGYAPPSGTKR
jgi:hypothetical protein